MKSLVVIRVAGVILVVALLIAGYGALSSVIDTVIAGGGPIGALIVFVIVGLLVADKISHFMVLRNHKENLQAIDQSALSQQVVEGLRAFQESSKNHELESKRIADAQVSYFAKLERQQLIREAQLTKMLAENNQVALLLSRALAVNGMRVEYPQGAQIPTQFAEEAVRERQEAIEEHPESLAEEITGVFQHVVTPPTETETDLGLQKQAVTTSMHNAHSWKRIDDDKVKAKYSDAVNTLALKVIQTCYPHVPCNYDAILLYCGENNRRDLGEALKLLAELGFISPPGNRGQPRMWLNRSTRT